LHRLEDGGAIEAEWGVSENNRKAKYYSLTPKGRQMLRAETATWKRYVAAVSGALETA
jgi:DNA-binding PadR family transcriptional regulator